MLIDTLLYSPAQTHQVLRDAWALLKGGLLQGQRYVLRIEDDTRSSAQNRKFHALCGEIADGYEWCGKRWPTEVWKRLLTAAWLRAQGEQIECVPALDGKGVDVVYQPTSKLSVSRMSELIEWTLAWCAEKGIEVDEVSA